MVLVDRDDNGTYYMWARLPNGKATKVAPFDTAQEAEREAWLFLEEHDQDNTAIILFRRPSARPLGMVRLGGQK